MTRVGGVVLSPRERLSRDSAQLRRALQKRIPPIIRATLVAASLIVGASDELAR